MCLLRMVSCISNTTPHLPIKQSEYKVQYLWMLSALMHVFPRAWTTKLIYIFLLSFSTINPQKCLKDKSSRSSCSHNQLYISKPLKQIRIKWLYQILLWLGNMLFPSILINYVRLNFPRPCCGTRNPYVLTKCIFIRRNMLTWREKITSGRVKAKGKWA